jgi:DNA polymerase-4
LSLARQVKQSVRRHAGEALRCSVGLGPNRLLAKIAGELIKPDGLEWLTPEVMPDKIGHLALDDLPGINRRMTARLNRAGVWSIPQLWDLAPRQARLIWGGVQGERFLRMLWGEEIPDPETRRRSVGHSQVLAPDCRNPEAARLVVRRLLTKAAARLRRMGFFASRLSLAAKCLQTGRWRAETRMQATQDSFIMLSALELLWRRGEMRAPLWVGVTLSGLIATDAHIPDLFERRAAPEVLTERERLCVRIDALNQRYGRDAIAFGDTPARLAAYTGAKIAFTRVPDRDEFMD